MRLEINRSFGWLVLLVAGITCQSMGWQRGIWAALALGGSVIAHEVGHLTAAKILGVKVSRLGASLKGGYIVRGMARTQMAERIITFAGPGTNLLLYLVLVMQPSRFLWWVASINLILAVANLIPVGATDGARLLHPQSPVIAAIAPEHGNHK